MPNILFEKHRGLADSIYSGIDGSYAKSVGVDFHSIPGALTVHQALAKHSGDTVTELSKVALSASDGSKLWFSATSGKIWRELSGIYTLVYTTSPAAGNAGCLGAAEFNGRIYWATQSREHWIAVSNIGSAASWTTNANPNVHTFTVTDASYHPHAVQNTELFIGDGYLIASINSAFAFTAARFNDILTPHRIRILLPHDSDLLIGTFISENVNYCELYKWDTIQDTWQFADQVYENGIRAATKADNIPVFAVGSAGRLYYYDGQRLQPWKRIPGSYSASAYLDVNPQAMAFYDNRALVGVSNGSGNPADEGLYDIGAYSKDYPTIISLAYPISEAAFTGVTIGAIVPDGLNLYVSWQSGSNYGVDKLSWSAKYVSAYLESRIVRFSAHANQPSDEVFALYQTLNGGSLTFSHKMNHATNYTAMTSVDDTSLNKIAATDLLAARALQLKMAFTVSGNNAPVVELWGAQVTPTIGNEATK